ncbi:hypothetical protein PMIN03_012437 [Paraphaeosphaeria minitans]
MPEAKAVSTAVRPPSRACLLCHSLVKGEERVLAVVGGDSFYEYSQTFLAPVQETRSGVKLKRSTEEEYISICSPVSYSAYCCRTSPLLGFLLHVDCIQTLRNACSISIHFRCIQPSYSSFDSVRVEHQIQSVATAIGLADLPSHFGINMVPEALRSILVGAYTLDALPQISCPGVIGKWHVWCEVATARTQ